MVQIIKQFNDNLPVNITNTAKKVQIGREMLNVARAELRAIDKLSETDGITELNQLRLEKLERAQQLAEDLLDAEVQLGQQIAELPEAPGKRTDLEPDRSAAERLTKKDAIAAIGISEYQARRYELLAKTRK